MLEKDIEEKLFDINGITIPICWNNTKKDNLINEDNNELQEILFLSKEQQQIDEAIRLSKEQKELDEAIRQSKFLKNIL